MNFLADKEVLGGLSVAIGIVGYVPYLHGLYRGKLKPHFFTWFLWGLLMLIAFAGQVTGDGGAGTWVTGLSAFMCLFISVIALFHGEKSITRSDWVAFIAGLATIPVWLLTDTPLWSMILIILIEFLATWPTVRKSWMKPQQESPVAYMLAGIKFVPSAFAMREYNFITLSYPVALGLMNVVLIAVIMGRRYRLEGRFNWD